MKQITLPSTRNNPTTYFKVLIAARKYFHKRKGIQADYEHGQWWITMLETGAQYSVVDAEGGNSINGFDFEQVTEGQE